MPRGINSERTNRGNANKVWRLWKKFLRGEKKAYDKDGNEFIPDPDEIFVNMYVTYAKEKKDPKAKTAGSIDKEHKVSNKGHIISLKNGRILLMTSSPDKKNGGYMTVGDNWKVHRAVWFSFAADAIQKKTVRRDLPEMYGMAKEVREIKNLRNLKKLLDLDLEVDHKDTDRSNNRLDNLELVTSEINTLFISLKNAKTELERMKILSRLQEPTIVDAGLEDGVHGIAYADPAQISDMAKQDMNDWLLLTKAVELAYKANPKTFASERYGMLQSGNMIKAFRVAKDAEGNITPEILPSAILPDGIKPTMTFDTSMPDSLLIE